MVAASILPVAIFKGKLYFLFGKENKMEDSAKGFSDFGGKVENGESIMETALREGAEELCGFLGDPKQLKQKIKKNGGMYKITHNEYHVHIFFIDFDENLPKYFTNNHRFLWNRMDKHFLNDSKFFEKQEIKWFSVNELRTLKHEFRPFYTEIVDVFLKNIKKIAEFINKMKSSRSRSHSLYTRKSFVSKNMNRTYKNKKKGG
jgi:8-oxo-dGTP pyrophosphatase MutT (NUDIX family)